MRARKFVVERAIEEYSLDESTGAAPGEATVAPALSDSAAVRPRGLQHEGLEGICANPLREEPHPTVIAAVRHFGVVGLVACALGTGLLRWCKSLTQRAD